MSIGGKKTRMKRGEDVVENNVAGGSNFLYVTFGTSVSLKTKHHEVTSSSHKTFKYCWPFISGLRTSGILTRILLPSVLSWCDSIKASNRRGDAAPVPLTLDTNSSLKGSADDSDDADDRSLCELSSSDGTKRYLMLKFLD